VVQGSSLSEHGEAIELKDPAVAALLAWLVPGLGHLYQGRTAKAILFFVCIMGTFVYGLFLGGSRELGFGRVVYVAWRPEDKRLPFFCQIGVGLPAMPALIQANRVRNGKSVWLGGFMAPPRDEMDRGGNQSGPTLNELNKSLAHFFELGTVYTMIAGLLNILAIYDAFAGPVFTEDKKKEDEDEGGQEEDAPTEQEAASAAAGKSGD
jgi:hypothetical protein